MKKIMMALGIIVIIAIVFLGIVELLYKDVYGLDLCLVPCQDNGLCTSKWEKCNHSIIEKIKIIIDYYSN